MTNFFRQFFLKKKNLNNYPIISFGDRYEWINYTTLNDSLEISTTTGGGFRMYTDSIKYWNSNEVISCDEKENIFCQVIDFVNKKWTEKPIIIINIDYEKKFWEMLSEKHKERIKQIDYNSNKEREDLYFNTLLSCVQNGGTCMLDNKAIKTEQELLEYWKSKKLGMKI